MIHFPINEPQRGRRPLERFSEGRSALARAIERRWANLAEHAVTISNAAQGFALVRPTRFDERNQQGMKHEK